MIACSLLITNQLTLSQNSYSTQLKLNKRKTKNWNLNENLKLERAFIKSTDLESKHHLSFKQRGIRKDGTQQEMSTEKKLHRGLEIMHPD